MKQQKIEEIWTSFGDKLKTFILSKVDNDTVADDILQEVFLRVHKHLGSLHDTTKIRPWIYQITRNVIIDHFRKTKKDIFRLQDPPESVTENSSTDVMTEAMRDMINMMDNLPPESCEALCLTELEGMSQKEYAEIKGISYTAAKSRIQRARKSLRDMLMKCCHYQFDKYGTVIEIRPVNCCCCQS